jgi:hypothetical protein
MKKIFLLIFFNAIILYSFGQSNDINNSYTVKLENLKKGIYLSNQEFIANNPSISSDFLIKTRNRFLQGLFFAKPNILKIKNENGKYKRVKLPCWGFYDGKDLYLVNHKVCYKVDYMGEYSKYSIQIWIMKSNHIPVFTKVEETEIIDFVTDHRFKYSVRGLKKLLKEKNSLLCKEFRKEFHKREKIDMYLLKMNN